jgi:ACS family allantoate permease-like MFS transporter
MFRPTDAPRHVGAEAAMIACWAIRLSDLSFIRWYLARQNKRKASIRAQPGYLERKTNSDWTCCTPLVTEVDTLY